MGLKYLLLKNSSLYNSINMKGVIVIPAGSGKTILSKNIKIHSIPNKIYKEVPLTNNWEKYNFYEIALIEDKINSLLPIYSTFTL
mgnify:CR=1 FL=1